MRLGRVMVFRAVHPLAKKGNGYEARVMVANRVIEVWKYLFLIFKSTGHKNYAIEAFTLLVQHYFILPPMLSEQLKWSSFVNCHGLSGKNISMDLHMEHLNRLCKTSIQGLGANKSEKAIGKTISVLGDLLKNFDRHHCRE